MQLTIEIDDALYTKLEAVAKEERCSPGQALVRVVSNLLPLRTDVSEQPPLPPEHRGYRVPVSKGDRSFTTDDAARDEEAIDLRRAA